MTDLDHRHIWLAPKCATEHDDGRSWCSTPEELTCEECGAAPIAYVRAGKKTAALVAELGAARAEIARLREALRAMVYEITHLSPMGVDGSHWCKISADALDKARAALLSTKGERP